MKNITVKGSIAFIVPYIMLMTIFSLKTIYYYHENYLWWLYAFVLSVFYAYFVYQCQLGKKYTIYSLVGMTLLFSFFPLEVEVVKVYEAIWGDGIELSGLAKMMPNDVSSLLVELLFYPFFIFLTLTIVKIAFTNKTY